MTGRVQIYWNSHKRLWSVRQNRRVVLHAENLLLSDCRFVVNERGRQRVLREKRKNVHAYVEGTLAAFGLGLHTAIRVTYNPYQDSAFVSMGEPITTADLVWFFSTDGRATVRARRTVEKIKEKI